ncbi:origin recognition complex subunit orc5 [Diaporthe amygdali]|uniref:origin recognition complex subunit orc5 n=1 Tax=Phomopsis amygdali TaxID=1214568 RepID=UPI0022FF43DD|nr:origin recognition complex subunit orc5 [Diaporthe amygdali]KAJ0125498.1 origin recognition complex subunit orc5 [Diaporthe amygdali]
MAQLPDELILSILDQRFPCRQQQIRTLATLISPEVAPCRNCIVYGTEANGKSAIVAALLQQLAEVESTSRPDLPACQYAIVNSVECVTGRHLFETTVRKVAGALGFSDLATRCESLAQLTFELSKMLKHTPQPESRHFVLVFDAIDRQREAPPTLLPALARLSEIIPSLTTVFIMTNPPSGCLRISHVAHVHFPNYTKSDFVKILSATPPKPLPNTTAAETAELWTRFCGAVHDALTKSAVRTLPAFQGACNSLWPRFTVPLREGNLGPKDFTKLLIAARVHFQDESLLDPGIILRPGYQQGGATRLPSGETDAKALVHRPAPAATTSLAALLPTTARVLLIAAYLASHNTTRHDLTLFSTYHHGKRRRRGGASSVVAGQRSKHRKIARKLLGAHAFVLERMMAIFTTVRHEWGVGGSESPDADADADVGMALATLSSLRLLMRVGAGGDPLDRGGKWRVNVGWEVIRSLGRSMHVEVEEWLIE